MADVPLFASSLEPYHDRLSEALDRVARSGRYILGPEVEAFEEEFGRYLGVRHCVGVANGTDALTIALRALGVGAGRERAWRRPRRRGRDPLVPLLSDRRGRARPGRRTRLVRHRPRHLLRDARDRRG